MTLTLRNVAVNGLYYAGTVGVLPAAALWAQARWWGLGKFSWSLRAMGMALVLAGAVLQVWSIVLLQTRGWGTPSPATPPVRFVSEGPYAWVRNPINLGESLLFLGLAAWFSAWVLLLYSVLAWLAFHVFIIAWEEPRHRRLYGNEFVGYCVRVSRWLPYRPAVAE